VGEVLGLEWSELHLDAATPYWSLGLTKSGRQCLMPLGPMLRGEVFTPEHVACLRSQSTGARRKYGRDVSRHPFPFRHANAAARFARLCADLSIEDRGFHVMRHTAATRWLGAGVLRPHVGADVRSLPR
jgi:integrase